MRFENIDFNKLYMEQKEASTFKMKSKEAWDIKADSMNKKVHKSIYNEQFLNQVMISQNTSLINSLKNNLLNHQDDEIKELAAKKGIL